MCEKEENGEWWRGQDKGVSTRILLIQVPSNSNDQHCDMQPTTGKKITKIEGRSDIFAPIGLIEMICCFKGPELFGGGGSLHLKSCCFFLLQEDTDQGELY